MMDLSDQTVRGRSRHAGKSASLQHVPSMIGNAGVDAATDHVGRE